MPVEVLFLFDLHGFLEFATGLFGGVTLAHEGFVLFYGEGNVANLFD